MKKIFLLATMLLVTLSVTNAADQPKKYTYTGVWVEKRLTPVTPGSPDEVAGTLTLKKDSETKSFSYTGNTQFGGSFKPGDNVQATFVERDGKQIVTSVRPHTPKKK